MRFASGAGPRLMIRCPPMKRALVVFAMMMVGCSTHSGGTGNGDTGVGSDTGTPDSGPVDAPMDTSAMDSGLVDSGLADVGPSDTGGFDSGPVDSGASDTGAPETDAGPPFMCMAYTACGGDVTGDWTIEGGCFSYEGHDVLPMCDSETIVANVRVSGSAHFVGDGSYVLVLNAEGTVDATFPKSCLPGWLTCDLIMSSYGGTWIDTGDACQGSLDVDAMSGGTGTWETTDSTLTLTDIHENVDTYDYCVTGDYLQIHIAPETPGGLEPDIYFEASR